MIRIKMVVPVTTDTFNDAIRKFCERYKDAGTKIDLVNIKKGPETVEQHYDKVWSELFTLREIEKAEEEGYDAVISLCASDIALSAAKEKLTIPVVGLMESALNIASMLGRKFSIIGLGGARGVGDAIDLVRSYGLENKLASIRLAEIEVLDIVKEKARLKKELLKEGKKALERDNADIIIFGCGGLSEFRNELQNELRVPVVDPTLVALKVAEDLVKLGLSQSKKAFLQPNPKKRTL